MGRPLTRDGNQGAARNLKAFRDLKVWRKAHDLTLAVYKATAGFPKEEQYSLTSQMRRSCGSIPANIAEGCGRTGDVEMTRFLRIAMGPASELEYHLLLSRDLKYLSLPDYDVLQNALTEVKRMLAGFIAKLNAVR